MTETRDGVWEFPRYTGRLRKSAGVREDDDDGEDNGSTSTSMDHGDGEEDEDGDGVTMRCHCGAVLSGALAFEAHHAAHHAHQCASCARSFSSSRLLALHVQEAHDAFFAAKVARNEKVFECIAGGCAQRFSTRKARRQHLIDKHAYPEDFEISGIEEKPGHSSPRALPARKSKTKCVERDAGPDDTAMENVVDEISKKMASNLKLPLGYGAMRTSRRNRPKARLVID